jgi:serine/threonine protein kinase/predicted Zn-dependent protease
MAQGAVDPHGMELDNFIQAYEAAQSRGEAGDLGAFLPEAGHPLYLAVLCELVRVELEFGWQQGRPRPLEEYQRRFPELFRDPRGLQEVTFEEYRLRHQAGERPSADEYRQRFGVDTSGWPALAERGSRRSGNGGAAIPEYLVAADRRDAGPTAEGYANFQGGAGPESPFHNLRGSDPLPGRRPVGPASRRSGAEAVAPFPAVGGDLLGFRLLAELGRGAFGRVYLAEQGDLADRLVALKVARDIVGESQTLARLQHTHIVPIHSVHRRGPLQVVCMPYFGSTTLADVLRGLQALPSLPRSGRELVRIIEGRRRTPPPAEGTSPALRELAAMSYVEAVLWVGVRLAEGLAHAHERGVLHRDLKPANVLLTDDGQPMLLDFNLAADARPPTGVPPVGAQVGGTLPYMAPEHLQAFQGRPRPVDARSDLYSLGVILYELLTGRQPFELRGGPLEAILPLMLQERLQAPPRLRVWNRDVTPAVESLVRHCLEPEPSRRYASAAQLREDLQRQLDHLPLKHAPERSLRERGRKWACRHPRLTSSTCVAALAALLLALGGTVAGLTIRHLDRQKAETEAQRVLAEAEKARQEAINLLHQTREEGKAARFRLTFLAIDRNELEEGLARGQDVLRRYQVLEAADWQALPAVALLPPGEQQRLREDIGELLWLMARATPQTSGDANASRAALRLNALAESCYAPADVPRVVWMQRAELAARLPEQEDNAEQFRRRAAAAPADGARHQYLIGIDQYLRGELRAARQTMQALSRQEPQNYFVWLVLGNCHAALARPESAVACYNAAVALWPEFYRTYHLRARANIDLGRPEEARADLDQALALQPGYVNGYLDRASLRIGLKDYAGAIADLEQARKLGAKQTRVHFMLAEARRRSGDREGAERDFEEGLRQRPGEKDEQSWISRGVARLNGKKDVAGALADFEEALQINPQSRDALQNKAAVLADLPGRAEEAVGVLDRAVALYPDFVPARAGRGVLLARLGRREAALRDARDSLLRDTSPATLYQVACIWALTSRQNPGDRLQAFQLLTAALRGDYGLDLIDDDHDLDPIRTQPEFRRLVQAARALRPAGTERALRP